MSYFLRKCAILSQKVITCSWFTHLSQHFAVAIYAHFPPIFVYSPATLATTINRIQDPGQPIMTWLRIRCQVSTLGSSLEALKGLILSETGSGSKLFSSEGALYVMMPYYKYRSATFSVWKLSPGQVYGGLGNFEEEESTKAERRKTTFILRTILKEDKCH